MAKDDTFVLSSDKNKPLKDYLQRLSDDIELQRGLQNAIVRGQRVITEEEVAPVALAVIESIFPGEQWKGRWWQPAPGAAPSPDRDKAERLELLKRSLGVCGFAMMSKVQPWSAAEKCHLGSIRINCFGTRHMVMTP